MQKMILHIGCGKTATTYHQKVFFKENPNIYYLGKPYPLTGDNKVWGRIDDIKYQDNIDLELQAFRQAVDTSKKEASNKPIVISEESLMNTLYPSMLAERLYKIFNKANILITIRNQFSAIESYYNAHGKLLKNVPEPWNSKYVAFDDWFDNAVQSKTWTFLNTLNYNKIVKAYSEYFGRENIHILMYEDFVNDYEKYAEELSGLIPVNNNLAPDLSSDRINKSPDSSAMNYLKLRSYFPSGVSFSRFVPFSNKLKNLIFENAGKWSSGFNYTDLQKQWVMDEYADGNKELANQYNLDGIHQYNYPVR